MKTFQQIMSTFPPIRKNGTNGIYLTVLTFLIVIAQSSCRKGVEPSNSFPVNKSIESDLIGEGIPTDIARFFAAVKTVTSSPNDTAILCTQTFPNNAIRKITMHINPNMKYTPTPDDIAKVLPGENPIYNFKFASSVQPDSSNKVVMSYFVPQSTLQISYDQSFNQSTNQRGSIKVLKGATSTPAADGAGISWEEIIYKGNDVSIGYLIDFAQEHKIKLGPTGPLYALASALNDVSTALQMSQENTAWLLALDSLENCAANPTSPVAKADPNYSSAAVTKVQSARTELKEVNAIRFLNLLTEKGADLNPVTAVLAVGLKQGFVWSEETLKDYSINTIMHEVRAFVVPCNNDAIQGNIDVQHDCTVTGPIGTTRTEWRIQTKVAWIYNTQQALYTSQGNYTFTYKETISGSGQTCSINRSQSGDIGSTGSLVVINNPTVQNTLGYGYTAVGNMDALVAMSSNCQGYTPQMQNWTIVWLPLIKAFTGPGGSYSGMKIDSCGSGHGFEKVTWDFSVPPTKK